jgi:CDP-diacylglycerol--serine O-phosphatidyltransferase
MTSLSKISAADIVTLANGLLGFVAITLILDDKYIAASMILFLSLIMDGLDGHLARRFGSKHSKGQVLDSISDSISFVFAPALLVYAEFREADGFVAENAIVLACSLAILLTGLFRLARFSAGGYQLTYFVGMPAPAGALLVILLCLLFGTSASAEPERYYYNLEELQWLVIGFGFLASFLMASEIRYPKIRGKMVLLTGFALLLAVLPSLAAPLLVSDQSLYTAFSRTATGTALALTLVYVFGGPVYEKLEGNKG